MFPRTAVRSGERTFQPVIACRPGPLSGRVKKERPDGPIIAVTAHSRTSERRPLEPHHDEKHHGRPASVRGIPIPRMADLRELVINRNAEPQMLGELRDGE